MKTEIIASSEAPADGAAELGIIIQLKNSDNSSVADYKPTYEIVSGSGVVARECTTSDNNGFSACILKATQPGKKRLRLTNALVGLEREIEFLNAARSGRLIGLAPGASALSTTPSGATVEFSVGEAIQGVRSQTQGDYKVFFSVQGALLSK